MRNLVLLVMATMLALTACNNKPQGEAYGNGADSTRTSLDSSNNSANNTMGRNSGNSSGTAMKDSAFLVDAYVTGLFEIKMAQLADKNSSNAQVKGFAKMMITDHQAMNNDVSALAGKSNITLPNNIDDDKQKKIDKLTSLNGKDFDKEYADINQKGHKDAVDKFEKTANGSDCSTDVKSLASKALPKLKAHLQHADMLQKQVEGSAAAM